MPLPKELDISSITGLEKAASDTERDDLAERIAKAWIAHARTLLSLPNPEPKEVEDLLGTLDEVRQTLLSIDPLGKSAAVKVIRESFHTISVTFEKRLKDSIGEKEIGKMTLLEIIAELRKKGIDPPENKYGKLATDDRKNTLLREFVSRAGEYAKMPTPAERFELLVAQVEYLLERMVAKQDQGKNYATNPREELTGMLNAYMLSREQILQATTYHPKWGSQVRSILKATTLAVARADHRFDDGVKLSYGIIAGSKGQHYLSKFIEEEFPSFHAQAKSFANLLFIAFDFADVPLAQGQRVANGTRNHNQTEKFDPISVQDPVAAFEQSWDRYGGNSADWRGWFLLFLKDIPDGLYGAGGNAENTRRFQKLLRMYFQMFFPVLDLIKRVPAAGECESYFPDAYDMLTLNELGTGTETDANGKIIKKWTQKEVLDMLGMVDGKNKKLGVTGKKGNFTTETAMPLPDWDGYDITVKGWSDMLELTFKHLGNNLGEKEILISYAAGKKGLINEMLAAAGKAKVFAPKHLRMFLEPMLTLYSLRLILATAGSTSVKDHMRHKIYNEIEKSMKDKRGLAGFPDEMMAVLHNLEHLPIHKVGWLANPGAVDAYIDELWDYREWPTVDSIRTYTRPDLFQELDHHQEMYVEAKLRKSLSDDLLPALRNGDMMDASKK